MTVAVAEDDHKDDESPLYHISFERLAALGRSPVTILAARRSLSSPSRVQEDFELADPEALVNEIAEYGAAEEDFIRTNMPVQEIVFRILLARRNEPTPLRTLHYELTETWSTPIRPINLTEEGLARILDMDTYYGFERSGSEGE